VIGRSPAAHTRQLARMDTTVDPSSQRDAEQLRLLATLHFVLAALVALVGLVPGLHLVAGIAMLNGDFSAFEGDSFPPPAFAWFFIGFGVAAILFAETLAILLVLGGSALRQRTRHRFCTVVAAISCAFAPLGTALGVCTLLVLGRASVRQAFGERERAPRMVTSM
jgi:hypothetical protein